MCTISFLPTGDGFHLVMNRDEQLLRMSALPPASKQSGRLKSLYPHELGGGTWIGANEAGMSFALINWYSQPQRKRVGTISRGEVIPALLSTSSIAEATDLVTRLKVERMNPFRLIIVSSRDKALQEMKSSAGALQGIAFSWARQHWFSSGLDEAEANRLRSLSCVRAAKLSTPASIKWLRRLHRSHHPSKGAFSICMHRVDACTVSTTELTLNESSAVMAYSVGPACQRGPHFTKTLRLAKTT